VIDRGVSRSSALRLSFDTASGAAVEPAAAESKGTHACILEAYLANLDAPCQRWRDQWHFHMLKRCPANTISSLIRSLESSEDCPFSASKTASHACNIQAWRPTRNWDYNIIVK
jgi:hypothetical protein